MICLPGLPQGARHGWNGCVDEELRRELLARREEDQRIRNLASPPQGQYMARLPDEVAAEWQRIDEENTRWLGELLSARGWPGRTLAGEEGTGAAWLLAQHADRDPVRQRAFLHALRGAVDQGEASPAQLAYLEDRVRIDAGQPQLYGTQFTVTDGEFGPPVAPSFRVQSGQGTGERLTSGTPVPADAR